MKNYTFLKAFFSPFKRPKLKFYLGKIAMGTPYFLPRKWVKMSEQDCIDKAAEMNARHNTDVYKPEQYKNYEKPVPIKWFGFNFVSLGWKTKFHDYRFEFAPMISIVFCKLQFCIVVKAPEEIHYWECWLYYENDTDHNLSRKERIDICRTKNPCIWENYRKGGQKETVDYYDRILKKS